MITVSDAVHICRRFSYGPLTGMLSRNGQPAEISAASNGYLRVHANGKNHLAHRVAWLLHYEAEPPEMIDHINGRKDDNRICNLRAANAVSNSRNGPMRANNTSGYPGVRWREDKQRWLAKIGKDSRHLGYFDTYEDAVNARVRAECALGYHENNGRLTQLEQAA